MKKFSIALLFVMITGFSFGQFSHRFGGTYFGVYSSEFSSTSGLGFTYFPKISFNSLSLGMPVSLALSALSGSGNSSGLALTYHIPVVADLNFGLGSTPDENDDRGIGGYIGGGFGFYSTQYTSSIGNGSLTAFGPIARTGIRFLIKENPFDIGFMYSINLGSPKASIIGISLFTKL